MSGRDADVAIIGAGVVGAFAAYYLARAGERVIVLDPEPGGGASAGNAGLLVPSYSRPMAHPRMLAEGVRALLGGSHDITLRRPLRPATLAWLARFALAARPGRAWRAAPRLAAMSARSLRLYTEFADAERLDIGVSDAVGCDRRAAERLDIGLSDAVGRDRRAAERLDIGVSDAVGRDRRAAERLDLGLRDAVGCDRRTAERLDIGLRDAGLLTVSRDRRMLDAQRRTAERLGRLGVASEVLDPAAVADAEPGLGPVAGAVRFPGDALVDPLDTTLAALTAAERHGAVLVRTAALRLRQVKGRVTGVDTEAGPVTAATVVLAAGTASVRLARSAGVRLPVEPGHGWSLTLPVAGPLLSHAVLDLDAHVVLAQRADRLRLTGGMELGGPPAPPTPERFAALRRTAAVLLPGADLDEPGDRWHGARPMTPDGLPIIRRARPGLVIATGHGQLGMTLAPATGELIAVDLTVGSRV
ncbi:NAD(P)/FAD-dependent oxidoreductase [Spongiactinospora sp. 9N601]|uniref:NAD(P)/FAD-dependent oxidoreductase n=1 Tax=Spongiactinospora sp. 9N601 TaxID=3375149 RepID=UPI0037903770